MSNAQSPKSKALQREVLKWLQTLNLSFYPKNVRRDFSNGYLVAEIFSRYHSQDFSLQSYNKGASLSVRQRNWSQIEQSLQKHNLRLTKEAVDGTIHCKAGAAELLVQEIYAVLTKRSVEQRESDFSDGGYQETLPALARSTASRAVENNLTATEVAAKPDTSANQRRARAVLRRHLEVKAAERLRNPAESRLLPSGRGASISYKEIKVHQPVRRSSVDQ